MPFSRISQRATFTSAREDQSLQEWGGLKNSLFYFNHHRKETAKGLFFIIISRLLAEEFVEQVSYAE